MKIQKDNSSIKSKLEFKIKDGSRHVHAAGTMIGLHIDTCSKCGRDLRDPIHFRMNEL